MMTSSICAALETPTPTAFYVVSILIISTGVPSSAQRSPSADCPSGCLCSPTSGHVSCENAGLIEVPRTGIGPSVTSLDLAGNQLMMLSSGSLSALRNVVRLKLNNNEIDKILDGAFESTPSLQTLDMSGNNLTVVREHTFRGAQMLMNLDLSGNKLSNVDGGFAGLRELSRLDLRTNRLTEITQFTFRDQVNLRYLLLSENFISHVDRRAFRNLEKLTYLVLRKNPISAIERFQFHSPFLSYVDLSECGLTAVPRGLPASIRYLQLRRNNISVIHQSSLRDCNQVSILVLDENSISEIEHGAFEGMHYLQQLWLNHNHLRRLAVRLPASVQRLLVESNSLLELSRDVFPPDSQLSALSLAGNNLPELPAASLSRLSQLRSLDVSVNNVRRLYGGTFANNTRLRSLQLSRNPLEYFYSGCFYGLTSLRQLAMAFVPSVSVFVADDAFRDIDGLTVLDMDSSPALVRSVLGSDSLLSSLSSVHELGLLNSHMMRLRADFPTYFPFLVVIRLSSARWHCDADSAAWLRGWIASTGVEVVGAGEIRCLTPAELRGRSLLTLAEWELQQHGGGDRRISPGSDVTPVTMNFSRVRPVATASTWSEFNQRQRPRPDPGGMVDHRQRFQIASRGYNQTWSSKSSGSRPVESSDSDDPEFDFIDRSDDMFRVGHRSGPRWNVDDEHLDVDIIRHRNTIPSSSPLPPSQLGRSSTTSKTSLPPSSAPVGATTISPTHVRAVSVERRQLESGSMTSKATTLTHGAASEPEVVLPPSPLPLPGGDSQPSMFVVLALSLTVFVTLIIVIVVVVIIVRTVHSSNRRQTKMKMTSHQQQQHRQQLRNNQCPDDKSSEYNIKEGNLTQKCILAKSLLPDNDIQSNSLLHPRRLVAAKLSPVNECSYTAHQRHHPHPLQTTLEKQQSPMLKNYVFVDDVTAVVVTSPGSGGNDGGAEALSLIPGRDINHEGPHLVYQGRTSSTSGLTSERTRCK